MPAPIDLRGQKFGRLTVVRRNGHAVSPAGNSTRLWLCLCDCGAEVNVRSTSLRFGVSNSCGCLQREVNVRRSTVHGHHRRGATTTEYHSWAGMLQRCTNPAAEKWQIYGGRGIQVCERWQSFDNFYADMGKKPSSKYSIDRIDNDGHYEPGNCRWATAKEQRANQRPPQQRVAA